jgi:hypothetical protein
MHVEASVIPFTWTPRLWLSGCVAYREFKTEHPVCHEIDCVNLKSPVDFLAIAVN